MQCPVCEYDSQRIFDKHGYWIRECNQCKHRFAELPVTIEHVTEVYADSYFKEGGAGYPDYLGEADLLIEHGARYGRLLKQYMPPGTVLDVGAAAGFILKGLISTGWTGIGVEPNPTMAEYARTQQNIDVRVGTLEDLDLDPDQQFDLVSMIQVVAHFYDLRTAFSNAAQRTKPGGYWLIETWNKDSFVARAFGTNWHEYSPPSVLHWFAPDDLHQLAAQFGFQPVAQARPAKWLNGAHVKSLLSYKLEGSALKGPVDVFSRLMPDSLPIPYPTFDLFWALYQKNA